MRLRLSQPHLMGGCPCWRLTTELQHCALTEAFLFLQSSNVRTYLCKIYYLVGFPIHAEQILSGVFSIGFFLLWIRCLSVALQYCSAVLMLTTQSQHRPHTLGAQSPIRWSSLQTPIISLSCVSNQLATNYSFIIKDTNRIS